MNLNPWEKSYNPISDGLAATIWECLRRNKSFQSDINNSTRGDDVLRNVCSERLNGNVFSRAIVQTYHNGRTLRKTIDLVWPDLPGDVRNAFEQTVDEYSDTRVRPFRPPNIAQMKAPYSEEDMKTIERFLHLWDVYELVAISRVHLDEYSRRKAMREVAQFVPKVVRYPLAAERQWATYLLFERLLSAGHSRGEACTLAAWEHLGRKSFELFAGRHCTPEGLQEAGKVYSRQSAEYNKRIDAVQDAVAKVYPDFTVFGAATQLSGEAYP